MLDTRVRQRIQPIFDTVAETFIRLHMTANQMTVAALMVGMVPVIMLFMTPWRLLPIVLLWLSGFLDALDGTIARKTASASLFGTIMDITFDRVVEVGLIIGLAYRQPDLQFLYVILASSIVLSMTVFLTVAAASDKASEKSFYYQPGLAERTEGFVMFSLLIALPQYAYYSLILFIVMIGITAVQRFLEAYRFFFN